VKRKFHDGRSRYEWKVNWSDNTSTWEPRESFVDNPGPDESVNDLFQDYCNIHPIKYSVEQMVKKRLDSKKKVSEK
jgi:hypothetical protein